MNIRFLTAALACAALAACAQPQPAPAPAPVTLYSVPKLAPASAPKLKVQVDALKSGHLISTKYAFCMADGHGGVTAAPDRSPRIVWSKGPAGTKSYAVIMYDTDSPAEHRQWMNQQGQTLTAAIKRKIYFPHGSWSTFRPTFCRSSKARNRRRACCTAAGAGQDRRPRRQHFHPGHRQPAMR